MNDFEQEGPSSSSSQGRDDSPGPRDDPLRSGAVLEDEEQVSLSWQNDSEQIDLRSDTGEQAGVNEEQGSPITVVAAPVPKSDALTTDGQHADAPRFHEVDHIDTSSHSRPLSDPPPELDVQELIASPISPRQLDSPLAFTPTEASSSQPARPSSSLSRQDSRASNRSNRVHDNGRSFSPPPDGSGPSRQPKPRLSAPPQPLPLSRYKPYGMPRQSSSSSHTPTEPDLPVDHLPADEEEIDLNSSASSSRHASPSNEKPPEEDPTIRIAPSPVDSPIINTPPNGDLSPSGTSPRTLLPSPSRLSPAGSSPRSTPPSPPAVSPRFRPSPNSTPRNPHHAFPSASSSHANFSPADLPPRRVPFKPVLPTAAMALGGNADGVDSGMPFESIDLETTPTIPQTDIPSSPLAHEAAAPVSNLDLPQDQDTRRLSADPGPAVGLKQTKRRSWAGFSFRRSPKPNDQQSLAPPPVTGTERRHSSAEVETVTDAGTATGKDGSAESNSARGSRGDHADMDPANLPLPTSDASSTVSDGDQQDHMPGATQAEDIVEPEAGPSEPRRHAPPAHPHPYPLPTSPTLTSTPTFQPSPTTTEPNSADTNQPTSPVVGLGVKGISAFEKFYSHTRPSWLPPKDRGEDEAHLQEWEDMMAKSREMEAARRKALEVKRLERERKLKEITPRWEELLESRAPPITLSNGKGSTLANGSLFVTSSQGMSRTASASSSNHGGSLPNGQSTSFSVEKVKNDESLRKMWFEGIPTHLRGKAWSMVIGNPLAMSKDAYKTYHKRATRALENGRFPQAILDQIESDLDHTLPHLRLYVRGSPMREDLRQFVCTWVVYRSDEGMGYAPFITHLSATFLLTAEPPIAFRSLCNLLSRPCLRAFYAQITDEIEAFYRVFENLQADRFPKIFANCKNLGLRLPESYFRSLFLEQLPFETCCRLWDQIVLEGDAYIFRAALAIFGFLEPRLHYPDKDEIESVLEGRNPATLSIVSRERERERVKGQWQRQKVKAGVGDKEDDTSFGTKTSMSIVTNTSGTEGDGVEVGGEEEWLDGKLSVFGLGEEALFGWLEDDDWRESRFERLVAREMPD